MRRFTIVCLVLLVILFFATAVLAKEPIRTVEGVVTVVSDGDTLRLETFEGTKLRVRLYGIDAPEVERVSRKTGEISKPGQPFGREAYEALKSKVLRKNVKVNILAIDRHRRMPLSFWMSKGGQELKGWGYGSRLILNLHGSLEGM